MRAIRKSDGRVLDVYPVSADYYLNGLAQYHRSDLDFDVEEETDSNLRISVAKLREVLNKFINPQGIVHESVDNIINKVKSEI